MKIGIFTECYKPVLNGVVNSIVGFKTGLEKLGHEVYIFCPTYKNFKDDPKDKNIIHCPSVPLPGNSGYHYIYNFNKDILKIAKQMDIIHVQHPFIMGQHAVKASKKLNKILVFTNHTQYDHYTHYIPFFKKAVIKEIIKYIRKFSKNINMIVAPAKGIENKLRSLNVKTPITIVPNGIDVKRFKIKYPEKDKQNIRKKYNIEKNDYVFVYSGRIADEKNLSFLLKAFKKINKNISNSKLLLIGGGVGINKYQKLIDKLHLNNKAIITDFIDYEKVPSYLSLGKIYITASKSEVHPLTILEGLAAGLPMVILNAPGTGDIVTDGLDGLVAKNNIDDFVNKVIKLAKDKSLYKKLSSNALKTADKYSYIETSKQMEKLYLKIIQNAKIKS